MFQSWIQWSDDRNENYIELYVTVPSSQTERMTSSLFGTLRMLEEGGGDASRDSLKLKLLEEEEALLSVYQVSGESVRGR